MDAVIRCTDFTQSQAHSPSVSGFFWVIILHSLLYIPHSDHQYTKYTLKPKTSHVPHGYPNLSQQHLSAGVLEERSIFLLHYWWLSAQQLNRCIKTNLGSHDCIVWIFKQLCVAEKQICSSLHHLWKALHGGSLHHPSNLISNHLPTHHAALPRLGLLSHLQRHQALSSKCTCLLGSLNFLLRAKPTPLLESELHSSVITHYSTTLLKFSTWYSSPPAISLSYKYFICWFLFCLHWDTGDSKEGNQTEGFPHCISSDEHNIWHVENAW